MPTQSLSPKLDQALTILTKKYGQGVVIKLNENKHSPLPVISTGALALDQALGVGGLPKGRIVEIYGPESSGKSTLALHCIAETQKKGGKALLIDTEHAFDPTYAEKIGVSTSQLLIAQPDYGEQALEIATQLIQSQEIAIVVIDSVAALLPKSELSGETGQSQLGAQARLMSQGLRKIAAASFKAQTITLFINQLRHKIGIPFGNPETTPGGNALRFYASIRLDIRKTQQIKQGETIIGHHAKVKVVKNKVAPPFKIATFDFIYNKGIDPIRQLLEQGLIHNIIQQTGTWFTYQKNKLGQGRNSAIQTLENKPAWQKEIFAQLKKYLINK